MTTLTLAILILLVLCVPGFRAGLIEVLGDLIRWFCEASVAVFYLGGLVALGMFVFSGDANNWASWLWFASTPGCWLYAWCDENHVML